jgi:hypothetical protein
VRDSVMPPSACPYCGAENNRATSLCGAAPLPGDVSICVSCQGVSVFSEVLLLRKPTEAERKSFERPENARAIAHYQRVLTKAKQAAAKGTP